MQLPGICNQFCFKEKATVHVEINKIFRHNLTTVQIDLSSLIIIKSRKVNLIFIHNSKVHWFYLTN